MTDQQDWDAAAAEAGYLPISEYVARWETAREAAHEALKTAREMITENERLREALAIAATWTAEPGVTIAEIRAALQPKEETQ